MSEFRKVEYDSGRTRTIEPDGILDLPQDTPLRCILFEHSKSSLRFFRSAPIQTDHTQMVYDFRQNELGLPLPTSPYDLRDELAGSGYFVTAAGICRVVNDFFLYSPQSATYHKLGIQDISQHIIEHTNYGFSYLTDNKKIIE